MFIFRSISHIKFKIRNIFFQNFRNLTDSIVDFSRGINIILGKNGNGKTNFLEAIYYLSKGRSFRKKNSFPQILSSECEKAEIIFNAIFANMKKEEKYVSLSQKIDSYSYSIDNRTAKRLRYEVIFISPFESFLFFNNSVHRKKIMNQLYSGLSENHRYIFKKYEKLIKQKNSILKNQKYEMLLVLNSIYWRVYVMKI